MDPAKNSCSILRSSHGLLKKLYLLLFVAGLLVFTLVAYRNHVIILAPLELFQERSRLMGLRPAEAAIFRDLLNVVDAESRNLDFSYFLYGGSLLGSFRLDDILPWDDDVDLAMEYRHYRNLSEAVRRRGKYGSLLTGSLTFKIWDLNGTKDTGYSWKYPFVDIFLYQDKGSYIQFMSWNNKTYNKSDIFPLKKGRFLSLELNVPKRSEIILAKEYGPSFSTVCQTHYWNHRNETGVKAETLRLNCSDLRWIYNIKRAAVTPFRNSSDVSTFQTSVAPLPTSEKSLRQSAQHFKTRLSKSNNVAKVAETSKV